MMRVGARIETFVGAGRFQHRVYDIGVDARDRSLAVSDEAIDAQKRANELAWENLPAGSGPIVSFIGYEVPSRGIVSNLLRYVLRR